MRTGSGSRISTGSRAGRQVGSAPFRAGGVGCGVHDPVSRRVRSAKDDAAEPTIIVEAPGDEQAGRAVTAHTQAQSTASKPGGYAPSYFGQTASTCIGAGAALMSSHHAQAPGPGHRQSPLERLQDLRIEGFAGQRAPPSRTGTVGVAGAAGAASARPCSAGAAPGWQAAPGATATVIDGADAVAGTVGRPSSATRPRQANEALAADNMRVAGDVDAAVSARPGQPVGKGVFATVRVETAPVRRRHTSTRPCTSMPMHFLCPCAPGSVYDATPSDAHGRVCCGCCTSHAILGSASWVSLVSAHWYPRCQCTFSAITAQDGRPVAVKIYEHRVQVPAAMDPVTRADRQKMHDLHIANEVC